MRTRDAGTEPIRVGYVTKMYPRFSETFIVNEIRGLERRGVEIEIFSLRAPTDTRFHATLAQVQAPVHYVPRTAKASDVWNALSQARRAGIDLRPDVLDELLVAAVEDAVQAVLVAIHAHRGGIGRLHAHFGSVATTVARLAARVLGIGYSFTAHAKDIFHDDVDTEDLRRKLADATAVVTVSDYNLRYLTDRFGEDAHNLTRVYNGLDLVEFAVDPAPRALGRVCAVGRLVEKKGFDDLIAAVGILRASGHELHLDLVGSGPQEDALRAQAALAGLQGEVTFHGPLSQDRVRAVVARAAIFAAPCVHGTDGNRDGLPTVLLESMALGTPVISTPVTGIPEAVIHERTGLLVPEHDPQGLATAIGRLLTDHTLAQRLAWSARAHVEAQFDVLTTSAQLMELMRTHTDNHTGVPA